MAETSPTTTAKDQLAKQNEARQKSQDKAVKSMEQVKPTPTQEENDLAKMGVDVPVKEDDGSGPDPTVPPTEPETPTPPPEGTPLRSAPRQPTPAAKPPSSSSSS